MDKKPLLLASECKTKKDIYEFISEYLQLNPIEGEHIETIDNEIWNIISGFRRAFSYHNVFVNKKTQQYAFHVSDGDNYKQRNDGFPNFGKYNSYDEMMEGVVDKYAILWKIESTINTPIFEFFNIIWMKTVSNKFFV
jgi:hypothetical protein